MKCDNNLPTRSADRIPTKTNFRGKSHRNRGKCQNEAGNIASRTVAFTQLYKNIPYTHTLLRGSTIECRRFKQRRSNHFSTATLIGNLHVYNKLCPPVGSIVLAHAEMQIYLIGILRGYAIRSGRHPEGSQRPPGRPLATDFPRDVCLTISRNHKVFLLSSTYI